MEPVCILMLIFAAIILLFAVAIYRGNSGLVRTFDWTRVKDKREYCRFLGKSVALCALPIAAGALLGCVIPLGIAFAVMGIGEVAVIVLIAKKSKSQYL